MRRWAQSPFLESLNHLVACDIWDDGVKALANSSRVLERSARMGINGVLWVMAPVIRKVIGRMEKPQLLAVCTHIRDLMA